MDTTIISLAAARRRKREKRGDDSDPVQYTLGVVPRNGVRVELRWLRDDAACELFLTIEEADELGRWLVEAARRARRGG